MDPNEALHLARVALSSRRREQDEDQPPDADNVDALADAFEALDNWLMHGGFLPEPWARARATAKIAEEA